MKKIGKLWREKIVQFGFILVALISLSSSFTAEASKNWREVKEGIDGYPSGPMLEIALRRTHADKLEMFKWRSEFISMLGVQPGAIVEREWHSISGIPQNTGAGTWTGMTWWENQQRWHDMANMLFPSPVTGNWLKTINMTLIFVKPLDPRFDLRTLAQSENEILELGFLVFPNAKSQMNSASNYLKALKESGANIYKFDIYPNPSGFNGPFTAAYNKNGPPATNEKWFVYMASYSSDVQRNKIHSQSLVKKSFSELTKVIVSEHSDIQVMTKTTSKVCCKKDSNICSLDPDECKVGILGGGDSWASSCNQCPKPCKTDYNICSMLSTKTCLDIGGTLASSCK